MRHHAAGYPRDASGAYGFDIPGHIAIQTDALYLRYWSVGRSIRRMYDTAPTVARCSGL